MSLTTLIKLTSSSYSRHFRGNGMKNDGPAFNYPLLSSIADGEEKSNPFVSLETPLELIFSLLVFGNFHDSSTSKTS